MREMFEQIRNHVRALAETPSWTTVCQWVWSTAKENPNACTNLAIPKELTNLQEKFPGWGLVHLLCGMDFRQHGPLLHHLLDVCHSDMHLETANGLRPIVVACICGETECVQYLASRGASLDGLVHIAVLSHDLGMIKHLVEWGGQLLDIPVRVLGALPPLCPLELIAMDVRTHINPDLVRYLVNQGAPLEGILPLACRWANEPLVRLLLEERWGDPEDRTHIRTPFALAAETWIPSISDHRIRCSILQMLVPHYAELTDHSLAYSIAHAAMADAISTLEWFLNLCPRSRAHLVRAAYQILLQPVTDPHASAAQFKVAQWFHQHYIHPLRTVENTYSQFSERQCIEREIMHSPQSSYGSK